MLLVLDAYYSFQDCVPVSFDVIGSLIILTDSETFLHVVEFFDPHKGKSDGDTDSRWCSTTLWMGLFVRKTTGVALR